MSRILVVEDEPAIAELVAINLRANGHEVAIAANAEAAQRAVDAVLPALVVLDWMLPGESGLALARRWRAQARTRELPIIMLTAREQEADKIAGLDAGADDYLTKPFSTNELMARERSGWGRPSSGSCISRWPIPNGCIPAASCSTGSGATMSSSRSARSTSTSSGCARRWLPGVATR